MQSAIAGMLQGGGRHLLGSFLGEQAGDGSEELENQTDFLMASPTDTANVNTSANYSGDDYYYYEYDYDASATLPMGEFVVVLLAYGLTLILGFVGNGLVILGITFYRRLHSVTNIFLVSLATADLLLVSICIPIKFAKFFTYSWTFGVFLCKAVHYLQNMSAICSVLTLTVMSIERYYAILHPMKARYMCTMTRTTKLVVAVWFVSFLLALPIIFGQDLDVVVGARHTVIWCRPMWSKDIYGQLFAVGNLVLILVIPVAVMTFAYVSIGKELWIVTSQRVNMRAGNQTSREWRSESRLMPPNQSNGTGTTSGRQRKKTTDDDHTRKQVIRMLVLIVVLFVVCWAPVLIDKVLVAFDVVDELNYEHLKYLRQLFAIMSYFNSCINPIVYAFMSKNFRESFKYTMYTLFCLKSCSRRRNKYQPPMNSSQSRATCSMSMSMSVGLRPEPEVDTRATLTTANFDSCADDKSVFIDGDTVL